jgi:peroxiredoxin
VRCYLRAMSSVDPPRPPAKESFFGGLIRDWAMAIGSVVVLFAGYNWLFGPQAPALGAAPDFTLTDLDGKEVVLSEQQGVVVLNFWFTSCPPCRAEIPELSRFHEAHPDIALYGVSTDLGMPTARLQSLSKQLGVRYPVLHDSRGSVSRQYGVSVFPTTLVIKDGQIVTSQVGVVNQRWLEAATGG